MSVKIYDSVEFLRDCEDFAAALEVVAAEVRAGEWAELHMSQSRNRVSPVQAEHVLTIRLEGKRSRI